MGQIFVLDRRTGKPVTKVEERPVDTNGAEGEKLSPTQPFSVGMPQIGNATLTEQDMWGSQPLTNWHVVLTLKTLSITVYILHQVKTLYRMA